MRSFGENQAIATSMPTGEFSGVGARQEDVAGVSGQRMWDDARIRFSFGAETWADQNTQDSGHHP
jgi:hypothetical protein